VGRADDDESVAALHRAIDLGVNFIDTALAYGDGRSERLVGQVVRERTETVHVATKVPPKKTVIPGMRSLGNVERNVAVAERRGATARLAREAACPSLGARFLRLVWAHAPERSAGPRARAPTALRGGG
jgi:Aldo/keto reductase family